MREREREVENYHNLKLIVFECTQSLVQLQTSFDGELHSVLQRLREIYNWIRSNFCCLDKQLKPHFKSQRILGDGEGDGRFLSLRYSKQKHHYHNYKSFCTNSFHGSSLSLQLFKVFLIIQWIKETTIYIELLSKYIKFAVLIIN